MKKFLMLVLAVVITVGAEAQILRLGDVLEVKKSKMIVALTDDDDVNGVLKSAISNFWTFCEITEYLPSKEAYEKAKKNDDTFVLAIGNSTSRSMKHSNRFNNTYYRTISRGRHIEISSGRGISPVTKVFIPVFGEDHYITEEIIAFGLSTLDYMFKTMDEKKLKNNFKIKSAYKLQSPKLKSKTLYIMEGWLSDKVKKEDIKKAYKYPIEIVSYEKWASAILSKEKGVAYCIVVPATVGGKYVYIHYIMDAETGITYGYAYPKVAVDIGGINVSKANSGYINKKNLTKYNDVPEGKW